MLVWKTNFHNPYVHPEYTLVFHGESEESCLRRDKRFFDSMTKGEPKATDDYSVEELENMGMVGLYQWENE